MVLQTMRIRAVAYVESWQMKVMEGRWNRTTRYNNCFIMFCPKTCPTYMANINSIVGGTQLSTRLANIPSKVHSCSIRESQRKIAGSSCESNWSQPMGDHAGVLFQPILSVVSKMTLNHVSKKNLLITQRSMLINLLINLLLTHRSMLISLLMVETKVHRI